MVIIGIVVIIIIAFVSYKLIEIKSRNNLMKLKNKVQNAEANVEVQLQRRFDLVPNLVETVKSFSIQEKRVLDSLNSILDKYLQATNCNEKLLLERDLNNNLRSLYTISGNYPQLSSSQHFLELQKSLSELEEDISYARQFYNDAVTIYNNALTSYPNSKFATKLGLTTVEPFNAVPAASIAPKIQLQYTTQTECPICGAAIFDDKLNCEYCGGKLK